jgi:hypothetical protein
VNIVARRSSLAHSCFQGVGGEGEERERRREEVRTATKLREKAQD